MVATRKIAFPRRGEIWLVSFDPTLGAEIKKTRPALILQNDIANQASPITIVAAVTSRFDSKLYPTEVMVRKQVSVLLVDSVVLLNQIRSVDITRLIRRLGRLDSETMMRVDRALAVSVGLIPLGRN